MNGLEEEFGERLPVYRLNAAEEEVILLQRAYGLFGHPAFALIDADDEIVQTFFGPQPAETLRQAILALLET